MRCLNGVFVVFCFLGFTSFGQESSEVKSVTVLEGSKKPSYEFNSKNKAKITESRSDFGRKFYLSTQPVKDFFGYSKSQDNSLTEKVFICSAKRLYSDIVVEASAFHPVTQKVIGKKSLLDEASTLEACKFSLALKVLKSKKENIEPITDVKVEAFEGFKYGTKSLNFSESDLIKLAARALSLEYSLKNKEKSYFEAVFSRKSALFLYMVTLFNSSRMSFSNLNKQVAYSSFEKASKVYGTLKFLEITKPWSKPQNASFDYENLNVSERDIRYVLTGELS